MKSKTVYYEDEANDEFSRVKIKAKRIDEKYDYFISSPISKLARFVLLRMIATPCAFIYVKVRFARKIVGKEKLLPYRKCGYFLYGNHTHAIFDAFNPGTLTFCQDAYTVVHPANVSMPLLGKITPLLGALPLPDTKKAYRSFTEAIEKCIRDGNCVVIFPEAHIWPYYTGIRNFSAASFYYPTRLDTPVFCFTNTYHKRLPFGTRIITYVDGPFFPDKSLGARERAKDMRDRVYTAMKERAALSTVRRVDYIKKENKHFD